MTTTNRRLLMAANRPIDVLRKFTFDRTGGDANINTCTAFIKRIKGSTIVWNQLLKTFANTDIKPGAGNYGTCVFSEQKVTLTEWKRYSPYRFNTKLSERLNHKLYLRIDANITSTLVQVQLGDANNRYCLTNGKDSCIKVCENLGDTNIIDYISIFHVEPVGTTIDAVFNNFMCIDLTLMFGAGNEPTSVEEFEKLFPLNYYEYNAGQLLSFTGDEIKTTGFNQLNVFRGTEYIIDTNPQDGTSAYLNENNIIKGYSTDGYIRNATISSYSITGDTIKVKTSNLSYSAAYGIAFPIHVIGGISYYLNFEKSISSAFASLTYCDISGNIISYVGTIRKPSELSIPNNAAWAIVILKAGAVNTEATFTNVCFNISHNGTKNGTYEEYEQHIKDISFYKSIKDGQGNTLFPYGLLSAGSVYDEVTATKAIKRIGVVDAGTLTWANPDYSNTHWRSLSTSLSSTIKPVQSTSTPANIVSDKYPIGSANNVYLHYVDGFCVDSGGWLFIYNHSFSDNRLTGPQIKEALSGVMVYYELAEPIEVDIDEQNLEYPAYRTGTEELLPANGAVPTTTPALFDIRYKIGGRRN